MTKVELLEKIAKLYRESTIGNGCIRLSHGEAAILHLLGDIVEMMPEPIGKIKRQ
jgi:hypothetical protein